MELALRISLGGCVFRPRPDVPSELRTDFVEHFKECNQGFQSKTLSQVHLVDSLQDALRETQNRVSIRWTQGRRITSRGDNTWDGRDKLLDFMLRWNHCETDFLCTRTCCVEQSLNSLIQLDRNS